MLQVGDRIRTLWQHYRRRAPREEQAHVAEVRRGGEGRDLHVAVAGMDADAHAAAVEEIEAVRRRALAHDLGAGRDGYLLEAADEAREADPIEAREEGNAAEELLRL